MPPEVVESNKKIAFVYARIDQNEMVTLRDLVTLVQNQTNQTEL